MIIRIPQKSSTCLRLKTTQAAKPLHEAPSPPRAQEWIIQYSRSGFQSPVGIHVVCTEPSEPWGEIPRPLFPHEVRLCRCGRPSVDRHGNPGEGRDADSMIVPRAPGPYPQVRWLDPPGTHPNHLRNGGGWSPRACSSETSMKVDGVYPPIRVSAGKSWAVHRHHTHHIYFTFLQVNFSAPEHTWAKPFRVELQPASLMPASNAWPQDLRTGWSETINALPKPRTDGPTDRRAETRIGRRHSRGDAG